MTKNEQLARAVGRESLVSIALGIAYVAMVVWYVERPELGPRDHSPEWQAIVTGADTMTEALLGITVPKGAIFLALMWPGIFFAAMGIARIIRVVFDE
ncbi:MAG: hypothetical protein ACLFNI_12140 [Natronomonas sp.]